MKKIATIVFITLSLLDTTALIYTRCFSAGIFVLYTVYNIMFAYIISGLTYIYGKIGKIFAVLLLFFITFIYIYEISLYNTYNLFFSFFSSFGNVNNVLKNYGKETSYVFLSNIPLILISLLLFISTSILIVSDYFQSKSEIPDNLIFHSFLMPTTIFLVVLIPLFFNTENNYTTNTIKYGVKFSFINSLRIKDDTRYLLQVAEDNLDGDSKNEVDNLDEEEQTLEITTQDNIVESKTLETLEVKDFEEVDDNVDDSNYYIDPNFNTTNIDFNKLNNYNPKSTIKNINSYLSTRTPTNKNEFTGILKGKNLILICAEAFSHHIIDKELTPTLYSLVNDGVQFDEFYVPSWGGSTTAGEFAFLTGLIAPSSSYTMKNTIGKNVALTMPRLLKKQGYVTAAFHNGEYTYYNRDLTHKPNIGFDDYYSTGNGIENFTKAWPNDIELISSTLSAYANHTPFCLYYMTMSGHAFYDDNTSFKVINNINRVRARYGNMYSDQVSNYICYQLYLEDALKKLIDILIERGLYDDTVICMVSDHFPYGLASGTFTNYQDYLFELYGGYKNDNIERDLNTAIIWASDFTKKYSHINRRINGPSSVIDILPTLLNLYGVDYDSRLLPGRDVFSNAEPIVVYNNNTIITDRVKVSSFTGDVTWKGEPDQLYLDRLRATAKSKESYSYSVITENYFNYLANAKGVPLNERKKYSMLDDNKVDLVGDSYESYLNYFKECNKSFLENKKIILDSRTKKEKTIYITIDDGPNNYCEQLLEILKTKNVKATFFITGSKSKDAVKKIRNAGHEIGLHCMNHNYDAIYKDKMSYIKDLYSIQSYVYNAIGEYSHKVRFPGGSNNTSSQVGGENIMDEIIESVTECGFEYYDWNASIGDAFTHNNPEEIYNNFISAIDAGRAEYTVLMHDCLEQTVKYLPAMIDYGIEKGYTFDVLSDKTIPIHFK